MSNVDTPHRPGTPDDGGSSDAGADGSGFDSFLQRIAAAPAVAPKLPPLGVGTLIAETYRVEAELGRGGMGVVFRATDLRLKRSIALKVHTRTRGQPGLELLRVEARALAHLTHPNVVEVFEIGTHDGRVFIAMEFVDGGTLDNWHLDRPWREILRVYLEAADGLAAAHAAGLVHRDFKPANVLMGRDGRPRVADFGLVLDVSLEHGETLPASPTASGPDAPEHDSAPLAGLSARATVGTPRYMAPEQADGRGADHRSDQYALCSALFEALTGDVPMDEATALPSRAGVPEAVWRAIQKGLAQEPGQRHESVRRLQEALRGAVEPRSRWSRAIAAIAGLVAVTGASTLYASAPVPPKMRCLQDARSTASVWGSAGPELRSALRHAGEEARADAFADQLDAYASAWLSMRENACERVPDDRPRDATMRCLSQAARAVDSVVGVLTGPSSEPGQPVRTLPLPPLTRCAPEHARVFSRPAAPPRIAAEVEDVLTSIANTHALIWHGDTDSARALAQATLRAATALEHPPTRIAALLLAGDAELEAGRLNTSHAYYEQAFYLAQSLSFDEDATEAAGALIEILSDLGDSAAADQWVKHAMSSFERLPADIDPEGEISLLSSVGNLRSDQGRYTEALRIQRGILAALPADGDEVRRSKAHNSLGATLYNLGDSALAIEQLEISLALNDAARGPHHPDNVYPLANLAWILIEANELDRAEPLVDRAIAMLHDKTAVDAYALATLLSHRGALYDERGEYEEALATYAEGLELAASELGDEHELAGLLFNNQAATLEAMGDTARAREAYGKAIRALEHTGNPENDGLMLARENLARLTLEPEATSAAASARLAR